MRCRIVYSGRVQGVGFRYTAARCAGGLAVTGWVRNEPDGTVQLEVQGQPAVVQEFLDAVQIAMGSKIHGVAASQIAEAAGESGFEIRR